MNERARRLSALLVLGGLALISACMTGATVPAPPPADARIAAPRAPSEALLAAHAELLRVEDRRELDLPLMQTLAADSSAAIRARVSLALGRLRRSEGAALLLHLLEDPDTSVAATAAFALGQMRDSTYAPALADRMMRSLAQGPTVAAEAAYALGKAEGSHARGALLSVLDSLPRDDASSGTVAASALLAVWRLAPLPTLQPVRQWISVPDAELRWRAAYSLARGGGAEGVPVLLQALADSSAAVRQQSLRGLTAERVDSAGLPRSHALQAILPLLDDGAYPVAINAARVLGSYSAPDAVEALSTRLHSPRRHLALAATESLGRIGAPAGAAAGSLEALATTDSIPVALRAAAAEALARIDPAAGDAVANQLSVLPNWRLRAAAARSIALIGGSPPEGLRWALEDEDPRVRAAALRSAIEAAENEPATIRKLLVEQLGDEDVIVRATALEALARDPAPGMLSLFLDAFALARADSLPDAALQAIDGIGALAKEGLDPTRAFLARFDRHDDPLVRLRAVERLDSAAVLAAWGEPLPIDTGRSPEEYRELIDWLVAPELGRAARGGREAILVTSGDTLRLRLFAALAPLTVENFLRLADSGYFDGQEWPRVVPNFVVQGGDPRGDTSGGPGYSIRDEVNRERYGAGAVGMALAGPDTGGSQLFITHSPQPHLDGTYTLFGEIVGGEEATREILPGNTIQSIRSVR